MMSFEESPYMDIYRALAEEYMNMLHFFAMYWDISLDEAFERIVIENYRKHKAGALEKLTPEMMAEIKERAKYEIRNFRG